MKINLFNLDNDRGRYHKYVLLALLLSLLALGVKMANGNVSTQSTSFRIADAATKSADGKTITAKAGFELVRQGENQVVARKKDATGKFSSDTVSCTCLEFPKCSPTRKAPCCNHADGQAGSCQSTETSPQSYTCKGSCDQCKWK